MKITSLAQTENLAQELAKKLRAGAVIALNGDLGAGKTTFIRALAQALGRTANNVTSPTFTILNIYPGKMPIYHFDFYRLHTRDDLENIGGTEFIPPADGITLIEWAEKIPEVLPEDFLEIRISLENEKNRIFDLIPHGRVKSKLARRVLSSSNP